MINLALDSQNRLALQNRLARAIGVASVLAAGLLFARHPLRAQTTPAAATSAAARERAMKYAELPLRFEANQGQTDSRVKFMSRGPAYSLYLTRNGALLKLACPDTNTGGRSTAAGWPQQGKFSSVLQFQFTNTDPNTQVTGERPLAAITNYFLGSDPAQWHTKVPNYAEVEYQNLYPGIDAIFHGNPQQLEYDLVVAPGADPSRVVIEVGGEARLHLGTDGDIVVSMAPARGTVPHGDAGREAVKLQKPIIYQGQGATRRTVAGRFKLLAGNRVGFEIGSYDRSRTLVIDPTIAYATYLGGAEVATVGTGIAVDSSGSAYVTGYVAGVLDFPTTPGSYEPSLSGGTQGFISKFSADGSSLVYSTYLGSSTATTYAESIAVDSSGNAYVTGATQASPQSFPTTSGSFEPQPPSLTGQVALQECGYSPCPATQQLPFVSKLSADGSTLVYSTFLDGTPINTDDMGNGIAVDSSGEAYVLGYSSAATDAYGHSGFPTTSGAFQPTNPGYDTSTGALTGLETDFVAKLSADGSTLVFGTYLGGSEGTGANVEGSRPAIAVDSSGDAYVSDLTDSPNFPVTSGAYQTTSSHPLIGGTYFGAPALVVTKFDPSGNVLYSTFLGGSTQEWAGGIAADSAGDAYVGGTTGSTNFPITAGAAITTCIEINTVCDDGFVTEIDPTGAALVYSTFLGVVIVTSTGLDPWDSVSVVGQANPAGFYETSGAFYACVGCSGLPPYILKLSPDGSTVVFSSYLTDGGTTNLLSPSVAVDSDGEAYLTAYVPPVNSSIFQTTPGAFQTTQPAESGDYSTNVSKIELVSGPLVQFSPTSLNFGSVPLGTPSAAMSVTLTNFGNASLIMGQVTVSGTNYLDFSNVTSSDTCSNQTILPAGTCSVSVIFTPSLNGSESAMLNFPDNATGSPQMVSLSGTGTVTGALVVLNPASVVNGMNFPTTAMGQPSIAQSFEIENEGAAPLLFSTIQVLGGDAGDFVESNTCPVAPNSLPDSGLNSCTVSIYFQPTQPGGTAESAVLVIASNGVNGDLTINLNGTSATPPGVPTAFPFVVSTDNSVPPQPSAVSAGLPAVSSGGQYVAFYAPYGTLVGTGSNLPDPPPGPNSGAGIYVRNTCAGPNAPADCAQSTQFVAYNPSGQPCYTTVYGYSDFLTPAISSDGRFVAFDDQNCSSSSGYVFTPDIYLRDTQEQTTTEITDQSGTAITGAFEMSANAEFFAFESTTESVQRPSGDNSTQAYINQTGYSYGQLIGCSSLVPCPNTFLVSQDNNGNEDQAYNNDYFEITTPAISPDGRYVAFSSPWNDVSGGGSAASDQSSQVYLRDTCLGTYVPPSCAGSGTTILISTDGNGNPGMGGSSGTPYRNYSIESVGIAVSAGGRYVVFNSDATNLPQPTTNSGTYPQEIYVVDTCQMYGQAVSPSAGNNCTVAGQPAAPVLLTMAPGGNTPGGDSFAPQISADGRIISFLSFAQLTSSAPASSSVAYEYAYDTCESYGQPVNTSPAVCSAQMLGVISDTPATGGSPAAADPVAMAVLDGSGQFTAYGDTGSPSEVWLNGTGAPVAQTAPAISVSPTSVNFGNVTLGSSSTVQQITVTSSGNANLIIGTLSLSGPNAGDFSVGNECSNQTIAWVAPNNVCPVIVYFTPSLTQTESATLSIPSNATSTPVTVMLSGMGTAIVTQATVPNVVGETESAAENAITAANLTVGTVILASSNTVPAGEVISENPAAGTLVSLGSAVNLTVSSGPPDQENITVTDTDWVTPLISVSAPVVYFSAGPTIGFSSQSGSQTLTVSDIGLNSLALDSFIVSGQGTAQFSVTLVNCSNSATSLPTTLPSGGACAFNIVYTPSGNTANDNATLTFTDSASLSNLTPTGSNGTQSIMLSGSGTSSPVPPPPPTTIQVPGSSPDNEIITVTDTDWVTPLISVSAPVVYFSAGPTIGFSGAPSSQTLTVSDIGLNSLALDSFIVSGQGAAQFSVTLVNCSNQATSLPTTLPSGGACAFDIAYTPSGNTANDNATLTFTDSASLSNLTPTGSNGTQSIMLSGSVTSSTVPGPPPAIIQVPASGTDSETITMSDQSLILVPNSINFGVNTVGVTSHPQTVTLANAGSAALTISEISAVGNFSVQTSGTTCGASVSGNANCTISITFTPKGPGTITGTLTIFIPGNPQTVALSGTGVIMTSGPITPVLPLPPGTIEPGQPASPSGGSSGATGTRGAPGRQVVPAHSNLVPLAPAATTITAAPAAVSSAPALRFSAPKLTFPDQTVGTASPVQAITLTNSSNAPLAITSITASDEFAQTNDCGESVAAGDSCTIKVTFKPAATGARTGTLTINEGAPGSMQTIKLGGTGKEP